MRVRVCVPNLAISLVRMPEWPSAAISEADTYHRFNGRAQAIWQIIRKSLCHFMWQAGKYDSVTPVEQQSLAASVRGQAVKIIRPKCNLCCRPRA